jgi:polysaccharide chain length determinant protein (PEP-CTERM system associated)
LSDEKQIEIRDILDAMIKKWYWITMPLLFFTFAGLWFYVILPRTFEATTLILVQSQEIPSSYVQPSVGTAIEEQVMTLSQEVLSRSNLESIIKEMNLFSKERQEGVPMDIIVASMRKKILVQTTTGGRMEQTVSFTITYRDTDPKKVADITNKLASFFIDSNLRQRARQATETTVFLEKQLADLKTLLQQQETKVQEYRNKFMGELPEQMTSNVSSMNTLQMRLETVQTTLSTAMNRRITLQSQLSELENNQPGATISGNAQRIMQLKVQYEEAKARYTPQHPSVRLIEQQIRELEGKDKDPKKDITIGLSPQVIDLKSQLKSANLEVESLRAELGRIQQKIDFYQGRVETVPKREQELATITRDYTITQDNYQKLLDRYYEAKRAESMEIRQQGEQFRIVDYALAPEVPVSPNPLLIAMIFLALGLGTGAGLIFVLEFMDSSVRGIKQLENWSGGIPCITAVPLAMTENDLALQKKRTMIYICINCVIIVAGIIIVGYSHFANITVNLPISVPF